jgi:hypothetical protein
MFLICRIDCNFVRMNGATAKRLMEARKPVLFSFRYACGGEPDQNETFGCEGPICECTHRMEFSVKYKRSDFHAEDLSYMCLGAAMCGLA